MARDAAIRQLKERLTELKAKLEQLAALDPAEEDRMRQQHVLVDKLGDAARDALGWVRQARNAAARAERTSKENGDPGAIGRGVKECQDRLEKGRLAMRRVCSRQFKGNLVDLARRRPSRWGPWTREARDCLAAIRKSKAAVDQAVTHCWQELAEQVAPGIVIRNVAIGQQIRKRGPRRSVPEEQSQPIR